jgi:hypothetical protein
VFLGHYGVAFALKRAEPKLSLGTLFVAVQFADLLWGVFLLLGWEHARIIPDFTPGTPFEFFNYPISHSLVAALAWGVAGAALYYFWPTRDTTRHWQASAQVGLAIFSHYPLDLLVHLPDLPLAGNDSPKLGLGLWNYPVATMVAELGVLVLGVVIYVVLRSQRHPVRATRLAVLLLVLLGAYFGTQFEPLSPSTMVVAITENIGQAKLNFDMVFMLAIGGLAAWADRRATSDEAISTLKNSRS